MEDLWERLRAVRARPTDPHDVGVEVQSAGPAPPGWEWVAPMVARRTLIFELESVFWGQLEGLVDAQQWQDVLCFDTETTGLSGGAGTVAFLVGWAKLLPSREENCIPKVQVDQWFLRDLPGEPELLNLLDAEFRASRSLVSFNGASFDLPLLKTRWVLSGRTFPDVVHRDDLPVARRLWKRILSSCRLGQLEQDVLGVQRKDDVPGSLVPELWFSYLRCGAAADFATPLEGVLRHHAQDVYSLLCLDLLIHAVSRQPGHNLWQPVHQYEQRRRPLARLAPWGMLHPDLGSRVLVDFWGWLALQSSLEKVRALEAAWQWNPNAVVGLAWGQTLNRLGDIRALKVWEFLWDNSRCLPALVETLKWLEHRDRSPEALTKALRLVAQAQEGAAITQKDRQALQKRRLRLEKRL